MKILTFNSNRMGQNIYLYFDEATKEGVLIDAGCSERDKKAIMEAVNNNSVKIKGILLTHGHFDHIVAAKEMKKLTGADIYAYETEKSMLESSDLNLSTYISKKSITVTPDKLFNNEDIFKFANSKIKVLHTPGHTSGCVCYYDESNGNIFTGDTLFKGSIGRTDVPTSNHAHLLESISIKLTTLPDDTKIFPGHGESSIIGYEKKHNPFLKN